MTLSAVVVIATIGRPDDLRRTLAGWRAGTRLPREVRVVAPMGEPHTPRVCAEDWAPLVVKYMPSDVASAAIQRNLGAEGAECDVLVFSDDDVEIPVHTLDKFLELLERDREERIGAVGGQIEGLALNAPSRLLRLYFRAQAGYADETYGGRFFGAAINLLPTDRPGDPELCACEWLPSTLVAYRRKLFERERFPAFEGYSMQEDVSLSSRVARTHKLVAHRGVRYLHHSSPGAHKDPRVVTVMAVAHRWHNAELLLGVTGVERVWKFALSSLFDTVWFARSRPDGWSDRIRWTWETYARLCTGAAPLALVRARRSSQ